MGAGVYITGLKGAEAGIGEMGEINTRIKYKRAMKRARLVEERETHTKKSSKRMNRKFSNFDDYDDYGYELEY